MKCCPKCKIDKPLCSYAKNSRQKDGLQTYCKDCHKDMKAAWLSSNRDRNNGYYKKWLHSSDLNKAYSNEKKKRRDASKLQAVPQWFEKEAVAAVYKKAAEFGFHVDHVDHVVPLQGKIVCGLHCWANLQLLESSLNLSKGNREWPDMP